MSNTTANSHFTFNHPPTTTSTTTTTSPPPSYTDKAAALDQYFTPDQSQSLQQLLLAHQSYLFRCLYEMETHLEISLEELKKRQTKTEIQIAKLNFLVESTRCNMLSLAKRLDALDISHGKHCQGRKKRKKKAAVVTELPSASETTAMMMMIPSSPDRIRESCQPEDHHQPSSDAPMTMASQVNDFSSPGYSDTSTLFSGCSPPGNPWNASKMPPVAPPPPAPSMDMNMDPSPDESESPSQRGNQFASVPTVPSGFSPATWMEEESSSGQEEVEPGVVQNEGDPTPGVEPSPLTSSSEPGPASVRDDMDDCHSVSEPERESDDEESVFMLLVAPTTPAPCPQPPSAPIEENLENNLDRQDTRSTGCAPSTSPVLPPSSFGQPSMSPPPSRLSLPSPPPLSTLSRSSPPPSPQLLLHNPVPETQAQEPALPLTIDPRELQPYLSHDLTKSLRSLSPLSDLSETTSDHGSRFRSVKVDEEADGVGGGANDSDASLDDIELSEVLTKSVRMKGEEKRALKSKKREMVLAKKNKQKRLVKTVLERERRKSSVKEVDKKVKKIKNEKENEKRKGKQKKIAWPGKYEGDEEDEFYGTLIECDVCSCWYHYGCVGIKPQDERLSNSEIYVCPVCTINGESKFPSGNGTCSRPGCRRSKVQPGEYFVSGIAGRKLRYDENGKIKFLYLVKWDGYSVADATWETKSTLPNPQKLIREFEEACQREGVPLDSPEPILLKEAVEVGWKHVLAYTDPPGVPVPLDGIPSVEREDPYNPMLIRVQEK